MPPVEADLDLGIFRNERLIEVVAAKRSIRNGCRRDEEQAGRAYDRLRELAGDAVDHGFEVLRRCPTHPERSMVDCVDCDFDEYRNPEDD
jgi:hypothetical protein